MQVVFSYTFVTFHSPHIVLFCKFALMMKRFSQPLKYVTVVLSAVLLVCIVWRVSLGQLMQGDRVVSQPLMPEWLVLCAIGGAGCAVGYALIRRLHLRSATFALHTALVCILSGAVVTYYYGEMGTCTLAQGQASFGYLTPQQQVSHFPFHLTLDSAQVVYHTDEKTPQNYIAHITTQDKMTGEVQRGSVEMNQIYRSRGYRLCLQTLNAATNTCTLSVNHDPVGIGLTYAGYALLALSMISFFAEKSSRWYRTFQTNKSALLPSLLGIGALAAFITYMMSTPEPGEQLPPVLDSPLLGVHIFTIITAYLLLLGIALLSIVALCLRGQGKRNENRRTVLHTYCEMCLTPAVFLLAIGIFIGAIWANVSWGRYWGWDPKETWALATLLIYALPLHRSSFPLFKRDVYFHTYCILAFASVLMTYFGVNHLLGGLHSYGG